MLPPKTIHILKHMDSYEREAALHQLQRLGVIDHMDILEYKSMFREREDSEPSEFVKSARKMLQQESDERTSRIKYKSCPACHGIGNRYVTTSISLRQGNFRRKDGSYHFEQDGTESESHSEWKTCPDCKGSGQVRA